MKSSHIKSIAKGTKSQHPRSDFGDGSDGESETVDKRSSWSRFWFTAVDPIGLHGMRVFSGLLFLFWLSTFAFQQGAFFSLDGWFDVQAYVEASRLPEGSPAPISQWSLLYFDPPPIFGIDLTSAGWVNLLYAASIVVLILFTLGLAPRLMSVLTWLIVITFNTNPAIRYGADYLLVLPAFYLMIGYWLHGQWSRKITIPERIFGTWDSCVVAWFFMPNRQQDRRSFAANLALRLLQVHFAVAVVISALHKLQMGEWWSGVALWYPLHPPFETTYESIRSHPAVADSYLFFWSIIQYAVLAWQFAFPIFAWRTQWWWRAVLFGGCAIGWLGMFFVFALPLFGPVYSLACLAYVTPAGWRKATSMLFGTSESKQAEDEPARKSSKRKVQVVG